MVQSETIAAPVPAWTALESSLSQLARRGTIWTVAGYGGAQVLRLGSNLILTRLLFPEAFGLMSLVQIVLQGLQMFSDVGIGPSIIQNARGEEPAFLRTAWSVQLGRGFLLWCVALILAGPVATLYEQPMLRELLPIVGLSAMIAGFNSTALFTMNRRMHLGRITVLELSAQAIGILVMVVWAWQSRTVWALAGGAIAGSLSRAVLSHVLLPGIRHGLSWDRDAVRALVHFGRWIFLSTLTTFLAGQTDRLMLGKLLTMSVFGSFAIAFMLAMMPAQLILKISSAVVFPAYSRVVQAQGDLREAFHRIRGGLIGAGALLTALVIACGPAVVRILYDPRYHAAGDMTRLLACAAWFQMLECTNGSALLAQGNPRWVAAGNVAKLACLVVLIPLGFQWGGLAGAIGGLIGAELVKYTVSASAVARAGVSAWVWDLTVSGGVAALATAGCGLLWFAERMGASEPVAVVLVGTAIAALGAIAYTRRARAGGIV